jgi:phosphoglycolate phosphatase-like HAD superfamily hydrolase
MTKLIIFDLDGVLVEAKEIHYNTLNRALKEIGKEYVITEAEHLSTYDGLKTNQKLEMLTKAKGLPIEVHPQVWHRKQQLTIEAISGLKTDVQKIELFKELRDKGYKLTNLTDGGDGLSGYKYTDEQKIKLTQQYR